MNKWIQKTEIPEWMTKGKTTLIQNGSSKNVTNKYKPITCLLIMWKIPKAQIREKIYSLISSRI